MKPRVRRWIRHALPWIVSAAALGWVFGVKTDWNALLSATRAANLPAFVAIQTIDKFVFFFAWSLLQGYALHRFVTPVSMRQVMALRGGAELLRAANNSLGDAAFVLGLTRLAGGRMAEVLAASTLPFLCHFVVLLLQASLSLLFLGGARENRDVAWSAAIGWGVLLAALIALRLGRTRPFLSRGVLGGMFERVRPRRLLPIVGAFVLLAGLDVVIQGLAARSFGLAIPWWALAGRIPLIYATMSLPSFGGFGTRELAWAGAFSDFAPHDSLFAYAFATNAIFLVLNVAVGAVFLPRALELVSQVRSAERRGEPLPEPLLHDAVDP